MTALILIRTSYQLDKMFLRVEEKTPAVTEIRPESVVVRRTEFDHNSNPNKAFGGGGLVQRVKHFLRGMRLSEEFPSAEFPEIEKIFSRSN